MFPLQKIVWVKSKENRPNDQNLFEISSKNIKTISGRYTRPAAGGDCQARPQVAPQICSVFTHKLSNRFQHFISH